jgi:hypothetical protein
VAARRAEERAENCADEYQQIRYAFVKTILPFVDSEMLKKVQARGMAEGQEVAGTYQSSN